MSINYAIIGGDLRIIELIKILANVQKKVYTYGLEEQDELKNNKNIICSNTLKQTTERAEIIIGPIPFSKDNEYINAPFSKKKISISDLISRIFDFLRGGNGPQKEGDPEYHKELEEM